MTAAEATTDPWLIAPDQSLMGRDLTKNLEVFRISHAKRKLRASFKMVRHEMLGLVVMVETKSSFHRVLKGRRRPVPYRR